MNASEMTLEVSSAIIQSPIVNIGKIKTGKDGSFDPFTQSGPNAGNFKSGMFAGEYGKPVRQGWHSMGTVFDVAPTPQEALLAAGMDFRVAERKAVYQMGVNPVQYGELAGWKDLVLESDNTKHNGQYLSRVATGFDFSQPTDIADLLSNIVGETNAVVHSAGVLDGYYCWVQMRFPGEMMFASDDVAGKYLTFLFNWTGKMADLAIATAIRIECQNKYAAVDNQGKRGRGFKMYHMGNMADKRDLARLYFKEVTAHYLLIEKKIQALTEHQIGPRQLQAYTESLFPAFEDGTVTDRDAEYRETVQQYFEIGAGNGPGRKCYGTAAAAHHALTEVSQHILSPKYENDRSKFFGTMTNGSEYSAVELEFRSMSLLSKFLQTGTMPEPVLRPLNDDGQPKKSRSRSRSTTPRTAVQSTAVVPAAPMSDFDKLMAQAKSLGFTAA